MECKFSIVYQPGKDNLVYNVLSRRDNMFPSDQGDFVANNPGNLQQLFEIQEDQSLKLVTMTTTSFKNQLKSIAEAQLLDPLLAN